MFADIARGAKGLALQTLTTSRRGVGPHRIRGDKRKQKVKVDRGEHGTDCDEDEHTTNVNIQGHSTALDKMEGGIEDEDMPQDIVLVRCLSAS